MRRLMLYVCPLAVLAGCPDNIGFWSGGCPSWEPNHTECVVENCEADLAEGIAWEDSEWCQEEEDLDAASETENESDTAEP